MTAPLATTCNYAIDWLRVLAIAGFAETHLNFGRPVLWYANEAVLPFYVLHQTTLLVVGYFVVAWAIPDPLKWAVISIGALTIILSLYWFVIRPFNPLRVLFGLKPAPAQLVVKPRQAQPVA